MTIVERRAEWLRGPWAERLIWVSIMALPFQQAFTVDAGFPLKISELFGAAGIVAAALENRKNVSNARAYLLLAALAALVLASASRAAIVPASGGDLGGYPRGLAQDLILYTGYAIFAIAFCLAISISMRPRLIYSAFTMGVLVSVVYCVIQFTLWKSQIPILATINGTLQWGSLYGSNIPRNGPFLEGNYLGFYAVTALFILAHARAWVGLGGAIALLLYSQSTGGFIAAIVGCAVGIVLRPRLRMVLVSVAVAFVAALSVIFIPPLRSMAISVLTKLGVVPNELGEAYGYSLSGRSINTLAGFSMAFENPVLGVGPGRYGYYYDAHVQLSDGAAPAVRNAVRPIANNVYAQISAEIGVFALIVFVALLVVLLLRARRVSVPAVAAVVALSIGAVAFPAWTALSFWGVIGSLLVIARVGSQDPEVSSKRAAAVDDGEGEGPMPEVIGDELVPVTPISAPRTRRQTRIDRENRKSPDAHDGRY